MYKYLLAAVAAAAIASPAAARDGQAYVGVEGGLVLANHEDFNYYLGFPAAPPSPPGGTVVAYDDNDVHFRPGVDLDVVAGYDFGMFRLEGELAWKSLHTKDFGVNDSLIPTHLSLYYGTDPTDFEGEFGADAETAVGIPDHATVLSLMGNALVDFDTGGIGFYAGVGAGRARVKMFGDRDNAWAFQGILGARMPISDRVDVGLKYRYFRTTNMSFGPETLGSLAHYTGDDFTIEGSGRLSTHSILASILFNLGSDPEPMPVVEAPAPLPEPAPATQTCPDGSVILATDVCPAPPPPPPAPSGERG
jgi:opacity protein-like surface antigen